MVEYDVEEYNGVIIDIDLDHIEKGVKQLTSYRNQIDDAIEAGLQEIGDKIAFKLQENLTKYGLDGTSLASSADIEVDNYGITITMGSEYASYVEFGTGIIGEGSPHPEPWAYDINNHGDKGWKYPKEDGTFGWTRGQISKPFMYDTMKWAKTQVTRILRKHLRRIKV